MLRYLTSGESHGECMLAILDGMPAGLHLDIDIINKELARRKIGYGRGGRMRLESDKARIVSGLRKNRTIGSPIAIIVGNKDRSIDKLPSVLEPRPGHADLTGMLKYNLRDGRDVLERASARETVARVGVGAIAKALLKEFDIHIISHVIAIGGIVSSQKGLTFRQISAISEKSPIRCADPKAGELMQKEIDKAMKAGDTVGGIFEVIVTGLPAGLGSHTQWDRKINGSLARAVMSIQAIKGVSFGLGFDAAMRRGSLVHDEIFYDREKGFYRKTNNAGGIEGGMTTGADIILRAAMKPISTLKRPISSVNISTKRPSKAAAERSDACAVPAAGVIAEAVVAFEISNALMEKTGGDSLAEMRRNYEGYLKQLKLF